jgi:Kef-type K+ transport system membrane component KefB
MDLLDHGVFVAILLTSTSLGVVLTVLKEDGRSRTSFGQLVVVCAAVADFVTVLLLTIFFSAEERHLVGQLSAVVSLLLFAVLLLAAVRVLGQPAWMRHRVESLSGATVQIRVRGSLALLLVFVAMTGELGVEAILGTFTAGVILSILSPGEGGRELHDKLETIGFAFFVPVFFVIAGARIDVRELLEHGDDLTLVPVLLVCVLLVKLAPASLMLLSGISRREALAGGLLQSAQLTFTIAGVEIGRRLGIIEESFGAALVLVAVASVLVAPLLYRWLLPGEHPHGAGMGAIPLE